MIKVSIYYNQSIYNAGQVIIEARDVDEAIEIFLKKYDNVDRRSIKSWKIL